VLAIRAFTNCATSVTISSSPVTDKATVEATLCRANASNYPAPHPRGGTR
jgi:hypothetical protein